MLWASFQFPKGAGWPYIVLVIIVFIILLIWTHRTGKLYK